MSKSVVIAFGRMNPPTTGHAKLIDFVQSVADRNDAEAIIFASPTQEPKKNPLGFRTKVDFLSQIFPDVTFNRNAAVRSPIDALVACSKLGFRNVFLVVGSDRVEGFKKLSEYVVPRSSKRFRSDKHIDLDRYQVVPVPGERDPDDDDVSGMSASKMRAYAKAQDYDSFRQGVPTSNSALAKQVYQRTRTGMGLREMALDKGIQHGKELRKPYYGGGKADKSCRPGGDCPYCSGNRQFSTKKRELSAKDKMSEACEFHEQLKTPAVTTLNLDEGMKYEVVLVATGMVVGRYPARDQAERVAATFNRGQNPPIYSVQADDDEYYGLSEAEGQQQKQGPPKQPTEADRIKLAQKRELLDTQKRQNTELLAAKTRDLEKQSRDQAAKLNKPKGQNA
jgi:hypothetical protein